MLSTTNLFKEYSVNINCTKKDIPGAIATSVVETSNLLDTKLIVAATMTGTTARLISNLKPKSIILATCPSKRVAYSLALNSGVYPVLTDIYESTDAIVNDAKKKSEKYLNKGDLIVITGGFPNNTETKITNFMKIEEL